MSPPRNRSDVARYTVSIRVTAAERRAIRRLADLNHVTVSALAGEALACLAGDLGESAPLETLPRQCEACRYYYRRACHTYRRR